MQNENPSLQRTEIYCSLLRANKTSKHIQNTTNMWRGRALTCACAAGAGVYFRTTYPRLDVRGSKDQTLGTDVGAVRVRFYEGVAAQLYYPTASTSTDTTLQTAYKYFRRNAIIGIAQAAEVPMTLLQLFGLDRARSPCLTCLQDGSPPPPVDKDLPVIVFSHGLFGDCDMHSAYGRQIAEQGWVVVVLEHEDHSASYAKTESGEVLTFARPDPMPTKDQLDNCRPTFWPFARNFWGPMLEHRVREIATVVEGLRNRTPYMLRGDTGEPYDDEAEQDTANKHLQALLSHMDTSRMVMAGHSFGGATAILAVQSELPALQGAFTSCLLYDPWTEPLPETSLDKGLGDMPTLMILSGKWGNKSENKFYSLTERLAQLSPQMELATLPGTLHQWVTDTPFWFPWIPSWLFGHCGSMEPRAAMRSTVDASLALLLQHESCAELALPIEDFGMQRLCCDENS